MVLNPQKNLLVDISFGSFGTVLKNLCFKSKTESGNGDDITCTGYRNLGIADYLRLEQEICCYVPGEVSHIENILQGEYKERATRKLRRSEITTTFETEKTSEKLSDTTTTDRYEMESETSQIIQNDTSFGIGVNTSASYGAMNINVSSSFATATATENSTFQAVNYAKDVTSRAVERIITRVREERVNKVIEEFEENNSHVLDNRNNSSGHVVGLYRWVDKVYKNQIVNYGKRLMIEFMIPEPAKFHLWAKSKSDIGVSLEEPIDPREDEIRTHLGISYKLDNHQRIDSSNYAFWAAAYDVKVDAPPALYREISKAYSFEPGGAPIYSKSDNTFKLLDNYTLYSIQLEGSSANYSSDNNRKFLRISIADQGFTGPYGYRFVSGYKEGILPIALSLGYYTSIHFNITARLQRTQEIYEAWKIDTFNKILSAYKEKKAAYETALSEAKAQSNFGIQIQGNNPLYNRTTEINELKKGCLQWLNSDMGKDYYTQQDCDQSKNMPNINFNSDLGCYLQDARFFEQAFDWNIMSYVFYSYFWGKKCSWKEILNLDDNDPIFRGFLQAGMARVIVPVKPNFEKAVMYYLETKEVWEGGEVPAINDDLYISIVKE